MTLDQSTITFLVAVAILTMTPGNDTMLVLRNSLGGRRSNGLVTVLGITSGTIVHGLFAAMGISIILMQSAQLFAIVKYVGAGYLVVLGLLSVRSALRTAKSARDTEFEPTKQAVRPLRRSFAEGFLTNVLNPKVALFYLSFLPQFITPTDPVFKPLLLASAHIMMGIVWLSALVFLIGRLRTFLARARNKAIIEGVAGTMLVVLGIRLAVDR